MSGALSFSVRGRFALDSTSDVEQELVEGTGDGCFDDSGLEEEKPKAKRPFFPPFSEIVGEKLLKIEDGSMRKCAHCTCGHGKEQCADWFTAKRGVRGCV